MLKEKHDLVQKKMKLDEESFYNFVEQQKKETKQTLKLTEKETKLKLATIDSYRQINE